MKGPWMNQKIKAMLTLAVGVQTVAVGQTTKLLKPNILFILTDDQGYGDLGRHGHSLLKTPNLDRLYDEGVRFDRFHVSPACAPTRAALMTGMHEFRNGITHTITPRERLSLDAVLLPELLRDNGYATGHIGKWHLGDGKGYHPHERGFETSVTVTGGGASHWNPFMVRNGKRDAERAEGFREDLFFDEGMAFIKANRDRPFFCYIATHSPHTPLDAPEKFVAPYRGQMTDDEALYLGMVANIDWNTGRILRFLEEEGLDRNTIVIVMNDNGATVGVNLWNAGMRGVKTTVWEGGHRALSLWRFPGNWTPRTVDQLTAHLDVLPTLCDLTGTDIPETLKAKLEGFSLRPLLEAQDGQWQHGDRLLFNHSGRWPSGMASDHKYASASVLQGDYLLIRNHSCNHEECLKYNSPCSGSRNVEKGATRYIYTPENAQFHWGITAQNRWALFNLTEDRECWNDLAEELPEITQRMAVAYEAWWEEMFPRMIEVGGDDGLPWPRGMSLHDFHNMMRGKGYR
jgi:arylsulfatase A-like enzyme